MEITKKHFERGIIEYSLKNKSGMTVKVINIGASITEILVPDNRGAFSNVVLRHESLEDYFRNAHFLGSVVAPVAGRVENAEFTIGDRTYSFEPNEGRHLLHSGGLSAYDRIWESSVIGDKVVFEYKMDDGFPGKPLMKVMYSLNEDDELKLEYEVVADAASVVAPTNHTYFNLSNDMDENIGRHAIQADVSRVLEMDDESIPVLNAECNGIFDLREKRAFEAVFQNGDSQIETANGGYDHYFTFDGDSRVAEVGDERSGRTLKVTTTFPGMVLYTGNNLDGSVKLKDRKAQKYGGFCLETQESPAALKLPLGFDVQVGADEIYRRETVFSFGVEE